MKTLLTGGALAAGAYVAYRLLRSRQAPVVTSGSTALLPTGPIGRTFSFPKKIVEFGKGGFHIYDRSDGKNKRITEAKLDSYMPPFIVIRGVSIRPPTESGKTGPEMQDAVEDLLEIGVMKGWLTPTAKGFKFVGLQFDKNKAWDRLTAARRTKRHLAVEYSRGA